VQNIAPNTSIFALFHMYLFFVIELNHCVRNQPFEERLATDENLGTRALNHNLYSKILGKIDLNMRKIQLNVSQIFGWI